MCKTVFDTVLADERFVALCPESGDGDGKKKLDNTSVILERLSPLCCFIGDEKMDALTRKALGEIQ